ncbi:MAG: ATP-binding protein [Vicinamibacteraceae bacterium]
MWHAAQAGLMPGDRLVGIEGRPATADAVAGIRATAEAGDTLELVIQRRQQTYVLQVPVRGGSASSAGYYWVRFVLAVLSWALGVALVAWRGDGPAGLLLGAGLLMIAPVTFRIEIPAVAGVLRLANTGWQLLATAYRFFFPVFLLHFLSLHLGHAERLRSPRFWAPVYVALLFVVAAATDGFRDPLAWSTPGAEQNVRAAAGLIFELMALGALALLWRRVAVLSAPLRWLAFVLFMFLAVGVALSLTLLAGAERGATVELLRQIKTLTLTLVLAFVAVYFIIGGSTEDGPPAEWRGRRRLATSAAVILTVLYGAVVAGAAGVALGATGGQVKGWEWILFAAVFTAAIVFSPVLRWAREMVDRHMFADWIALEDRVREFLSRVGAELEPSPIVRSVSEKLPPLLRTSSATLVLARDVGERWELRSCEGVPTCSRAELTEQLRQDGANGHCIHLPVRGVDGEVLGFVRFERGWHERAFEPSERALLRNVADGLSSALRNTETYLEMRKAQQNLSASERIASLGALAGGLAHEIKNPLASLKLGVHLLDRTGVDRGRIRRMQQDVRRIDDLVTSLLRFTHDGSVEETHFIDVGELSRECASELQALAQDRGASLLAEPFPPGPILIAGGLAQLRLVISNVLTNALNAVGEGGRVSVRAELQGDSIELIVEDEGPGIPAPLREAVFRLDYSTTPGGTGLGLVLARREVERLGGSIWIDAAQGQGTILRVRLPVANRASDVPSTSSMEPFEPRPRSAPAQGTR